MRIEKLKEIQGALTALSKKKSELGYQWAKNLNLVNAEIKKSGEDLKAAKEPLYEKDEDGNNIQFVGAYIPVGDMVNGTVNVMQDTDGNAIINVVKDENGVKRILQLDEKLVFPHASMIDIAPDNVDKWKEIYKAYKEEEHEINWHKIPETKFMEVAAKEMIEGELILPIDGVIIEGK